MAARAASSSAALATPSAGRAKSRSARKPVFQLERGLLDEPEALLHGRAGLGVEQEELDEPEDGEERIRQVVGDVGRELAQRGGAGEGQELLLQGGSLLVR